MKQVWVKASTCSRTAATTRGEELPTLTTAMPAPRSIKEFPSTSTSTPPPARSMNTGSVVLTPADTAAARRAASAGEGGPGISVTSRRSWGGAWRSASRSVTGTPRDVAVSRYSSPPGGGTCRRATGKVKAAGSGGARSPASATGQRPRSASSRGTYRAPSGVVEQPEVLAALRLQLGQLLAVDLPDACGGDRLR